MFKLQAWNQKEWITVLIAVDRATVLRDKANRQIFAMVIPAMRVVDEEGNEYESLSS